MSVKIRIKRGKIYLDIYEHGRRRWESLGLTVPADKQQAREIMKLADVCRSKREAQITSGEWGLIDKTAAKQTLSEYIGSLKNISRNTRYALNFINKHSKGDIILSNITEKWMDDFQGFLKHDSGLAKGSAKTYESAIRSVLKKAVRDRLITHNPSSAVKTIKAPESDMIYLELSEISKLVKIEYRKPIPAEIKKAFLFACLTGLRISDIKTLQWGDIKREPLQIAKMQKKTGNKVFIPLHETAWKIINDGAIHNYKAPVFPNLSKTKSPTNKYLERWARKAGIEKQIGWHTARRTFAILSLESGTEIYTLSKLMGHTDVKTTQLYAAATDKMKRQAVNALPGIEI